LLDKALATNEGKGAGLCIAVIDIDYFKAINDAHGHEAGDAVLEHFARSCRERVRAQDCLGRTGGEEFLLLLPEVSLNDAVRIIDRTRGGFPPAVLGHSGLQLPCTFSAGVTEALPDDDRSSILRRADRALYAAKDEGRNRTRIGSEGER
jgi:diguanylate cyclase (GGDEF)-like protein